MFAWSRYTFTVDSSMPSAWQANILDSIRQVDDLMEPDWAQLALGPASVAFVPWSGFMTLPGASTLATADAGALVYTSGDVGQAAYIAAQAEAWGATTWLHEVMHVFGLADQPFTPGDLSLMGYADPNATGLTVDVVEAVQGAYGPDSGDNRIVLTGRANGVVKGGAGRDTIEGAAGAEVIYGNTGDDILVGGGNADTLFGGQGADLLRGGDGDDVLYGNLANDTLSCGVGLDRLYGGQGDDIVYGGDGDTVFGGVGADTIWATPLTVIGQHDPADTIMQWFGV